MMVLVGQVVVAGHVDATGIRQDARSLVARDNALLLAAGIGLASVAWSYDQRAVGQLEENPVLELTDVTNLYGSSKFNLPAAVLAWSVGRASGQDKLSSMGSASLRALLYVQAVVVPIKIGVGRERPDGSNRRSFPSGHTANSFALAEVFRSGYGWKVGAPLCGLGVFTALGRMEENVHHLSDVIVGAAIGIVIGRSVNVFSAPVQVAPTPTGMSVSMAFLGKPRCRTSEESELTAR
jgi:membrane-associated phospholipid phosphatase